MGFFFRLFEAILGIPPAGPHDADSQMYADRLLTEDYNAYLYDKYQESVRNSPDIQFVIAFLEAYDESLGREKKTRDPLIDTWYTEIRYILKDWDKFPETFQFGRWIAQKAELFALLNPITFPIPPKWELPPKLRPRSRK
jgi:hypothetical protein